MAGVCIFCGGIPLTKEHLWPDWLRREARIKEPFDFRVERETDGVETLDRKYSMPPFKQTVRAVCARCNGGWMSSIEASAKPIFQDLVYARGRTLSADDQRTLAAWAFLKACVFEELHPTERVVPIEHRRRFYTYKQAPATGVAIWLGTYEAEEVAHYAYQGLKVGVDGSLGPEEPNIYIVTITMGALAVQIAGSLVPELAFDDLPLPSELHVVKIWPASENDLQFPQNVVMRHESLLRFSTMLYNVMGRLTGGAPPAR